MEATLTMFVHFRRTFCILLLLLLGFRLQVASQASERRSPVLFTRTIPLPDTTEKSLQKSFHMDKGALADAAGHYDSLCNAIAYKSKELFYNRYKQNRHYIIIHLRTARTSAEQSQQNLQLLDCQLKHANFLLHKKEYDRAKNIYERMLTLSQNLQLTDKMALIYQRLALLTLEAEGDYELVQYYLSKSWRLIQQAKLGGLLQEHHILTLRLLARSDNPKLFDSTLVTIGMQTRETHLLDERLEIEETALKQDARKIEHRELIPASIIIKRSVTLGIIFIIVAVSLIAALILRNSYFKYKKHPVNIIQPHEQQLQHRSVDASKVNELPPLSEDNLVATDLMHLKYNSTQSERPEDDNSSFYPHLYNKILNCLENKKMYTNPDFNIQHLSVHLKRHRRTVSKCIKEQGDTSFAVLVNTYRINEARRLIKNMNKEQTLNEIAEAVGFKNRISFYRSFKENTGYSPSAYLERVRQKGATLPNRQSGLADE